MQQQIMEKRYYFEMYYLQNSIDEFYCNGDLDGLLELMEDLQDLKGYVSDKIEDLKKDNDSKEKYTLKQLRQAWAAGKFSVIS